MEDIEELCKRVVIVKSGEIIYDGDLEKITEHTGNEKTIVAVLSEKITDEQLTQFPNHLGRISLMNELTLKVNVEKKELTQAVSKLLQIFPINDLNIEAQDISDIIEKLMKEGLSR
jgi:ABC-2 type transport system ATP-binding protein